VRQVDKDGSGEIGFHEFLAILKPKEEAAGKCAIDKIVHLQDVKNVSCCFAPHILLVKQCASSKGSVPQEG